MECTNSSLCERPGMRSPRPPHPPLGGRGTSPGIWLARDRPCRAQRLTRTLRAKGPAVCNWGVRQWAPEQKQQRPGAHSPHQDSVQAHSRLSSGNVCTGAHSRMCLPLSTRAHIQSIHTYTPDRNSTVRGTLVLRNLQLGACMVV